MTQTDASAAAQRLGLPSGFAELLAPTEKIVLGALEPPGRITPTEHVLEQLAEAGFSRVERTLRVYVSQLRHELQRTCGRRFGILAIPGHGYCVYDEHSRDRAGVAGILECSLGAQLSWVFGRPIRRSSPTQTFLLHGLASAYPDGVLEPAILDIVERTTPASRANAPSRWGAALRHLSRLREEIGAAQSGIAIKPMGRRVGYRLVLPAAQLEES